MGSARHIQYNQPQDNGRVDFVSVSFCLLFRIWFKNDLICFILIILLWSENISVRLRAKFQQNFNFPHCKKQELRAEEKKTEGEKSREEIKKKWQKSRGEKDEGL